ncbi:hypothetical protein GCM10009645_15540 [Mycolicibacterium poriferae]|jgi:hypothetical protein|uniref:Uncharacterized protein n=1 Tax=Mycolicibacterium poriferae TaxID=39694 RepID=A0A6N4V9D5_9MYCO|nr:hypothetical protein [Mycolicibacterium poriferae]MCV7261660.1 hypothetical protein [Mycolicibacterium poriferae]BBX52226.1 hypothetical protein MPOR_32520 [Mycolicibacterium poriferae]
MFPGNPFGGFPGNPFQSLIGMADGFKSEYGRRVRAIFSDVDPEQSPLAHSVQSKGDSIVDLLDGLVHAVAELEQRLPEKGDRAA